MHPIYLLFLCTLLLFHSPRTSQCISLSRLCGRFGHSCFGGRDSLIGLPISIFHSLANWGKRASIDEENNDQTLKEQFRSVIVRNVSEISVIVYILCF